jgi:hypothetical protein
MPSIKFNLSLLYSDVYKWLEWLSICLSVCISPKPGLGASIHWPLRQSELLAACQQLPCVGPCFSVCVCLDFTVINQYNDSAISKLQHLSIYLCILANHVHNLDAVCFMYS